MARVMIFDGAPAKSKRVIASHGGPTNSRQMVTASFLGRSEALSMPSSACLFTRACEMDDWPCRPNNAFDGQFTDRATFC